MQDTRIFILMGLSSTRSAIGLSDAGLSESETCKVGGKSSLDIGSSVLASGVEGDGGDQ